MPNSYYILVYKKTVTQGAAWTESLVPLDAVVLKNDTEMAAYIAATPSADAAGSDPLIGYLAGTGGTVTQATSKATAFTLSKLSGQITTAADALNTATIVSPVWTNTLIAATDVVMINHVSGGTVGSYTFNVQCAAGSATLNIRNATGGSLSEALVLQFVVLKGATA